MPIWEQQSPLSAAAGAAGAFLQGQEQAKERQYQQQEQTYMDKVYAAQLAAQQNQGQERIDEKAKEDALQNIIKQQQVAQKEAEDRYRQDHDAMVYQLSIQKQQDAFALAQEKIEAAHTLQEMRDTVSEHNANLRASVQITVAGMRESGENTRQDQRIAAHHAAANAVKPMTAYQQWEVQNKIHPANQNEQLQSGIDAINQVRQNGGVKDKAGKIVPMTDTDMEQIINASKDYDPQTKKQLIDYIRSHKQPQAQGQPNMLQGLLQWITHPPNYEGNP